MRRRTKVKSYKRRSRKGKHYRVKSHGRVITKSQIIQRVKAKHGDMPQKDISQIFDSSMKEIGSSLRSGHNVRVSGLGTFRVKTKPARPARKGMNPFTKKMQTFKAKPASKVIKFRPSGDIKP